MDKKAEQVIEIVTLLAMRVLGGTGCQLFLERNGELVRAYADGHFPQIEKERIKIGEGATGQVFERKQLLFSPLGRELFGPGEGGYQSIAASPLWAALDKEAPAHGVLVIGYDEQIQATPAGRKNLGQFAWAIAQVIGVYQEPEQEEAEIQSGGNEEDYQWDGPGVLGKKF